MGNSEYVTRLKTDKETQRQQEDGGTIRMIELDGSGQLACWWRQISGLWQRTAVWCVFVGTSSTVGEATDTEVLV